MSGQPLFARPSTPLGARPGMFFAAHIPYAPEEAKEYSDDGRRDTKAHVRLFKVKEPYVPTNGGRMIVEEWVGRGGVVDGKVMFERAHSPCGTPLGTFELPKLNVPLCHVDALIEPEATFHPDFPPSSPGREVRAFFDVGKFRDAHA